MRLIIRAITSGYKNSKEIERTTQDIEVELNDLKISDLEQILKFEHWLNTHSKSRFHIEIRKI